MKPTHLYIKFHALTGMFYFGKTERDPYKYLGSGKHWKAHIAKHGREHVKTVWVATFDDRRQLEEFALWLSEMADVVNSPNWGNLMPENGINGGNTPEMARKTAEKLRGRKRPPEVCVKTGKVHRGKTISQEQRRKQSEAISGRKYSSEHKAKIGASKVGKPRSEAAKLAISLGRKKHYEQKKNVEEGATQGCAG